MGGETETYGSYPRLIHAKMQVIHGLIDDFMLADGGSYCIDLHSGAQINSINSVSQSVPHGS